MVTKHPHLLCRLLLCEMPRVQVGGDTALRREVPLSHMRSNSSTFCLQKHVCISPSRHNPPEHSFMTDTLQSSPNIRATAWFTSHKAHLQAKHAYGELPAVLRQVWMSGGTFYQLTVISQHCLFMSLTERSVQAQHFCGKRGGTLEAWRAIHDP